MWTPCSSVRTCTRNQSSPCSTVPDDPSKTATATGNRGDERHTARWDAVSNASRTQHSEPRAALPFSANSTCAKSRPDCADDGGHVPAARSSANGGGRCVLTVYFPSGQTSVPGLSSSKSSRLANRDGAVSWPASSEAARISATPRRGEQYTYAPRSWRTSCRTVSRSLLRTPAAVTKQVRAVGFLQKFLASSVWVQEVSRM